MKILMIPYIGISVILILGIILIYGLILLTRQGNKINKFENLDEYTNEFYMNELDKIIENRTVYNVDLYIGNTFSNKQSVNVDIPNEELLKLYDNIVQDIYKHISPRIKEYYINVMGETWYNSYIRTTTMSLVLNYSNLTLENLTIEKFTN